MPFSTPDTADSTKQSVSTAITATASDLLPPPLPKTSSMPPVIWSAPRPSEVAEPNSVAKIATTSIALPGACLSPVAEERPERRRHQVAVTLAVREVPDREADHGVHRPRDGTPQWKKEYSIASCAASGDPGSASPIGGALKCVSGSATPQNIRPMPMPVANIIDTHENVENSGSESSGPELDVAVAGEREVRREQHEPGTRQHEQPAEVLGDPREDRAGLVRQPLRPDRADQHERHGQRGRDAEDDPVDAAARCRPALPRRRRSP